MRNLNFNYAFDITSAAPSTSPGSGSSSRRSSAESGAPAKVTRSQRSSAPSELGIVSPTREAMSPPISSPAERKKSLDGKDRKRQASGDKVPEVRVAKTPETRSPVGESKSGKIPETRIPKSPETRLARSSDGKFARMTPESRGSRSLSAESRSSPTADSRTRRLSAPDRTRQLSGSGIVKPPDTVPEHTDTEKAADVVKTGQKVGDTEGKTSNKPDEVVVVGDKEMNVDSTKDISSDTSKNTDKDIGIDISNKETNTANDIIIKQEPDVKLHDELPMKTENSTDSSLQPMDAAVPAAQVVSESKKAQVEVKVEKERESKSKSDRAKAKVKHKKKHKHKHDKGKEERSRDRHKGERRRKSSEKAKLSDLETAERSSGNWSLLILC